MKYRGRYHSTVNIMMRAFESLGRLLDISPRGPSIRMKSSAEAIHGDWERLGGDMRRAMKTVEREKSKAKA